LFLNWIASSEHCQGQCVSDGRGFRRQTALGLTTLVVLVFGNQLAPSWLRKVPQLELAAIADSGTLFAFFIVSTAVLRLRKTDPSRIPPFRVPAVWILAPLSVAGCVLLFPLSTETKFVLLVWSAIGLLIYFSFRVRKSRWEQFNKA
jgi:APA family basic amino acid/polyamine antiporter